MNEALKDITFKLNEINNTIDGTIFNVEIKVPMSIGWIERMKFIIEGGNIRNAFQLHHKKNENDYVYFSGEVFLPTKAIYHYYFSFEANHQFIYYKKKNNDNFHSISQEEMWKLSVNFNVPMWAQGGIIYHIFIDRFNKSKDNELLKMNNRIIHDDWYEDMLIGPNENGLWNTDFYGGDLKGIVEKLPYIKSLGTNIIYLSPIFKSQSNHRYDTSDYEIVDPYAGVNDDLRVLCDEAHKLDIKIILDAVFNHTGNDSKYFNEYNNYNNIGAYQSVDSKYYKFYKKYNNEFCYWWGMPNLPVCDSGSIEWQNYIYGENGIIDKWFNLGIDGLRLDVADELSDEFIEGIRLAVKRNKEDGFILGEVWKNPMHMGRGYIESGKGMDSVMNYPLMDALIRYFKYNDINKLKETLRYIEVDYPTDTINSLMNFTSTHDISRIINILSTNKYNEYSEWAWNLIHDNHELYKNYKIPNEEIKRGLEIYKAYLFTLTFLPGNLSIFYGDEIGLEGMGNLLNRKTFPWNNINYELLDFVKYLGSIRTKEIFLKNANLDIIDITDRLFIYKRENKNEDAIVYINKSDEKVPVNMPSVYDNIDEIYGYNYEDKELMPFSGVAFKRIK